MKILFLVFLITISLEWRSFENQQLRELFDTFLNKADHGSQLLEKFVEHSERLEKQYDDWGYTCCRVKKGYKFCIACCDKWEVASCNIGFNSLNCTCSI